MRKCLCIFAGNDINSILTKNKIYKYEFHYDNNATVYVENGKYLFNKNHFDMYFVDIMKLREKKLKRILK